MIKKILNLVLIAIAGFSMQNAISQTTVTILLSQGSGQDAYLASGSPGTNYGSHGTIGGNTWTCNSILCLSRGLFQFDISSIPAGAMISNASLQLFADLNWSSTPTTGGPNNAGFLSRVTTSWVESGVTWGTQPTITTNNQVTVPGSATTNQNYTLNVTALVQDMLTNTNNGFMLQMQDEVNYYKSLMFASSDNVNSSKVPVLTIVYTITGIKELYAKTVMNVYPNPFSNSLNVECSKEMKRVVISDMLGNTLVDEHISSKNYSLNKKLEDGMFILSVYGENNEFLTSKKVTNCN